jgi:hypothetical protein
LSSAGDSVDQAMQFQSYIILMFKSFLEEEIELLGFVIE